MAPGDSDSCDMDKVREARTRVMVLERGMFRQYDYILCYLQGVPKKSLLCFF